MSENTRKLKIKQYGAAHAELSHVLEPFPREMWQFKSSPEGWSIHEIIVHLADSEANGFIRLRKAIAEQGSTITPYDEAGWARALHYEQQSAQDALALFGLLRRTTYDLLQSLPESVWAHTYEHPESGAVTLDNWLDVYVDHSSAHLKQMQNVYKAWTHR